MSVQPCADPRCSVHARGADPAAVSALTCARQVLRAYDRADAIALLEQEAPWPAAGGHRVLLSLRSSPLAAGQSERVVAAISSRRQVHHFRAERILLTADPGWRVDDVLMGGKSQVAPHGKLPAELFGSHVVGSGIRAFDRIARPIDVELAVTRVGGAWAGSAVLVGAILGSATYEPRVVAVRSRARVLPGGLDLCELDLTCPVEVDRFVVEDGADWIVNDLRVDGKSLFAQSGDVPGEMFSPETLDNFVHFGVIRAGSRVSVLATYVGNDPDGRLFAGELRGQEPEPEPEPE